MRVPISIYVLKPHALLSGLSTPKFYRSFTSSCTVCSIQHPRFTHLIYLIQSVFPSTPTFYIPDTSHTLRVPFDTHVLYTCYMSYTACSLRQPRFIHLLHVIHCVFPSTTTFYTPATCHTLRVPFDNHVLYTCYMSYTACSLRQPRFIHLLHVIHCVFPSTTTFYTPATCHTLRVPFNTHVLHTSYTVCLCPLRGQALAPTLLAAPLSLVKTMKKSSRTFSSFKVATILPTPSSTAFTIPQ